MSTLGAVAIATTLTSGFAPAYPWIYHKNYAGSVFATTLLVLLAASGRLEWHVRLTRLAVVLLGGGLLATQSRGAMLALAAGGLVWFVRTTPDKRRRTGAVVALGVIAFVVVAGMSLRSQIQDNDQHNSIHHREEIRGAAISLWEADRMTGAGLRYWNIPPYVGTYTQPNDTPTEALAESGIPGLIGFVVFVVGALLALARARGDLALAALCVLSARFFHGLFDIYWVGGTTTLVWLIAGMGLAGIARPPSSEPPSSAAPARGEARTGRGAPA
nr:O-antigen ligase family protein [Motilibacter aurantiacus]